MRFFLFLLLVVSVHAHPVRVAYDAKVVNWEYRCNTNNPTTGPNYTITLLAQSQWMGEVRNAGFYPGLIIRANFNCGRSFGGTNGAGDSTTITNIGSPQVPLIPDEGAGLDTTAASQDKWIYAETGLGNGLRPNGTNVATLNTQLSPATMVANHPTLASDFHAAVYASGVGGAGVLLGAMNNLGDNMLIDSGGGGAGQSISAWTFVGAPSGTDTNTDGFYVGTRTSSSSDGSKCYRNTATNGVSTSVGASPVLVTAPVHIFGVNQTGAGIVIFTSGRSGGYALGLGLTPAQITNQYNNAWQRAETMLGRK